MDRRTTFKDDEELITFLSALQEESKKVSLLVDGKGIVPNFTTCKINEPLPF